jgi:hypothetical protein
MEEIYQSRECNFPPEDQGKNAHNAYFNNGAYNFNFPDSWYNTPALNKAVGLRRIDTRPRAYDIRFKAIVGRRKGDGAYDESVYLDLIIHIRSDQNIEEALSTITLKINQQIRTRTQKLADKDDWVEAHFTYDHETFKCAIVWDYMFDFSEYNFKVSSVEVGPEFSQLMNIKPLIPTLPPLVIAAPGFGGAEWDFLNVWDREILFIHASFVTYTSRQYLGRGREFYFKPSKIYYFGNSSQQFNLWVSFNGIDKANLYYENFIIELALLLDSKHYQSE